MATPESTGPVAGPILHIELVHSDPYACFAFLQDCLGAVECETKLTTYFRKLFGVPVVHARVGNVVFQIGVPPAGMASWQKELDTNGPGIHNVTFYVNDTEKVKQKMESHGSTTIFDKEIPVNEIGFGKEPHRVVVMDAKEKTGLRFEFCEPCEGWPAGGVLP